MSDVKIPSNWDEETIKEKLEENPEFTPTRTNINEILTGEGSVYTEEELNEMSYEEAYRTLVRELAQEDSGAYHKKMSVADHDTRYWLPEDSGNLAKAETFDHEMPAKFSRNMEDLEKRRFHYLVRHPETNDVIVHMMEDEYTTKNTD
jgi:hypothetical protein